MEQARQEKLQRLRDAIENAATQGCEPVNFALKTAETARCHGDERYVVVAASLIIEYTIMKNQISLMEEMIDKLKARTFWNPLKRLLNRQEGRDAGKS